MNLSLGLSNSQTTSGFSAKHQQLQNSQSKVLKMSRSSKDLNNITQTSKNGSTTPKSNKSPLSGMNSPKNNSTYQSKTSTPRSRATPTNLSSHTPTKSWNSSPTPSNFYMQKNATPSRFSQAVEENAAAARRMEESNFSSSILKSESGTMDQAYFNSLKLFTEEGDVNYGQKSGRNSELSMKQKYKGVMSPQMKSKTPVLMKSNSTANVKNSMTMEKARTSPLKSGFYGVTPEPSSTKPHNKKTKSEGSNGLFNKVTKDNLKDYDFDAAETKTSQTPVNDEMHVSLREILSMGCRTPQPGQLEYQDQIKALHKEREEDKKTIKLLQEKIVQLENLFEKSLTETKSSEGDNPRDSPDFPANVNTTSSKFSENDIKQKEVKFLQIQNDTLKMTSDILKKENEILKQSQSHLLQFKEAARRYRDLANSKAAECVTLAEEVITLRKERGLSTNTAANLSLPLSESSFSSSRGDRTPPSQRNESLFSPKGKSPAEILMMKSKSARSSLFAKNSENTVASEMDMREAKLLPRPQEVCVKPSN